ncbi:MAG: flippase [Methanomicrobiales archaeon]|nr:flippase [Methanomicrobiales archaeon]
MVGNSIYRYILANKLLKETSWSFLAKGVSFVLFIALNIFLARALGPEDFGRWSFFLSIITVFFLLSYFGINNSSQKYAAQYNQTSNLKSVIASSFRLRIVVSSLFSLLLLIIHEPLAALLGRPDLALLFLYAVPFVFLAGIIEYLKCVFEGLHRLKYNFIVNLLEYGLKLILVVIALCISGTLLSIVDAFTLALLIASLIGLYLLYIKFYRDFGEPQPESGNMNFTSDILRYSLPLFIISVGFLIATEVDTIMLGLLSTDTEVGIYAVAKQITIKIPHISLAIAMGTIPAFAKLNESNRGEFKKLFNKLLKINAYILFPIVAFILVFSGYLVPLIFGFEYSTAVLPLQILAIYLLCASFSVPLGRFLDYRGLAAKRAINMSVAMFLNITLNLLLIPSYGAVGAAIGTSVSFIPYVLLNWFEVRKEFS